MKGRREGESWRKTERMRKKEGRMEEEGKDGIANRGEEEGGRQGGK